MQHNFRELLVWQKSMELTTQVYELSKQFPKTEQYGLTSQIRRCAVSIPSNIAEGAGRDTKPQFAHFLAIAQGSAFELETQLLLTERLGLTQNSDIQNTITLLKYSCLSIFILQWDQQAS
jgi:four helix bundle protein